MPPTAVGDTEIELRACGLCLSSPIPLRMPKTSGFPGAAQALGERGV